MERPFSLGVFTMNKYAQDFLDIRKNLSRLETGLLAFRR
jgi:hypothetical protein